MAYNEQLANRIRERFAGLETTEEKAMMGGLIFMYNGKMCVGIMKNELTCRIDPSLLEEAVERPGCRQMTLGGKTMNGYVLIDDTGIKNQTDFDYWIDLALAFNPFAKASQTKK